MSFFRFGGSPDWLGWQPFVEWSGHWLAFPVLARRIWTTLAKVAYFCGAERSLGQAVM